MTQSRFVSVSLILVAGTLAVALSPVAAPVVQGPSEPTAQHKILLEGVGVWEGTLTMDMPGAPKSVFAAKETVTAVGLLWTQARFECDIMGVPYVGTGCLGYDVAQKKVVGTWIDSHSTAVAHMAGEIDLKTKTVTLRWQSTNPENGKKVANRSVTVRTATSYTATFYMGEGEGTQSMVIVMKRKGKATSKATSRSSR